jgi:pyruvate dehydrogenase E2 component (dihydrolipoamide acetyltransferase)
MTVTQVTVPDIGAFSDIPVIEVHVGAGDMVAVDDPLITLESDKATMDVPSSAAGAVQELHVGVGDRVSEGSPILSLAAADGAEQQVGPEVLEQQDPPTERAADPVAAARAPAERAVAAGAGAGASAGAPAPAAGPAAGAVPDFAGVHAGPSVRRLARELGLDLGTVTGTGAKGRITKEDLLAAVRPAPGPAAAPAAPAGRATGVPAVPAQDFSRFGPVETRPLSRIQKLSGPFLHRSWLNVPHVTHHDEADITDLDSYRRELDTEARAAGYRVTLLAFLLKAAVSALREFPTVNASLSPEQDSLILKRYYHLGVAVDTPDGLVVPVLRDVDRKGVRELSRELGEVSATARAGKLTPADLAGGTFTISSLGGIGGTAFTPIVNAPEVAILGVVRNRTAPVWDGATFVPRLLLPLSLSYDHRVVDGALAARFTRHLATVLEDVRRLVL